MRSDICLILEGTYPYIAGGVSTWVQQILEAMPQYHFSILYIGPRRDMPRQLKYRVPENVCEIREVFVHDYPVLELGPEPDKGVSPTHWRILASFMRNMAEGKAVDVSLVLPILEKIPDQETFMRTFSHSLGIWELIREEYRQLAPQDISFLDYFWTHRFVNIPALNLLRTQIPQARVYHSASTGYAGLLGAKAAAVTGMPFLLTEHGIYTRERRIEIFNAAWIRDISSATTSLDLRRKTNFFKEWWIRFFLSMSRTAYNASSQVFSLFEANRQTQIRDGADPDTVRIIPNGIETHTFLSVPSRRRSPDDIFRIGFVGRITAIKDIKTLLRGLDLLQRRGIKFEAILMGPMDEEPEYAQECRELTQALGLGGSVQYPGRVKVSDYLSQLDVVVLTSISEGLPFVVLEANCAGIPVVSTDVGSCRDLLNGATPEDRALGPSGLVTSVGMPGEFASALEQLAKNPELCQRMSDAGRARVKQFYDIRDVMNEYRDVYEWYFYTGRHAPDSCRWSSWKSRRLVRESRRQHAVSKRDG